MKKPLIFIILILTAAIGAWWIARPGSPEISEPARPTPKPPDKNTLVRSNLVMLQSYAESFPDNPQVHYYLAEGLRQRGRFDEALRHFEIVLGQNKMNDAARVSRAFCLLGLHRYADAREALLQDIRLFPAELTFQHILTRVLATSPDDAVRDGKLAGQYLANLVNFRVDLGLTETIAMVWAENGDFQKATQAQQDAINMARESGMKIPAQLLENLQRYVEEKPCRLPWPDDAPVFTMSSYVQGESIESPPGPWEAPGLTMKQRMQMIVKETDPMVNIYQSGKRAETLEKSLVGVDDINKRLELLTQYATELLRAGRSEEALQNFQQIRDILENGGIELDGDKKYWLLQNIALSHLRIGEQDNCIHNHNAESCLFPLRDGGIHVKDRGSRGAIPVLEELLDAFPDNLSARWLLNIAYMTLGQYPQDVPSQWLIDPEVFQSEEETPIYPNVSAALNLDRDGLAGGSVVADFNNDGLLDVVSSSWALDGPLRFSLNKAGAFSDQTEAAGLNGLTSGLNMVTCDYNNDGWTDLFVLRGAWLSFAGQHPNSLLRNNGDGSFTDVTEQVGLLSFHPTQTAVWHDFNNDGWQDVFIGNESSGPDAHPCELYLNNGDGTFKECAGEAGIDHLGFVKGATAGDYDNDRLPDLYLSCMDEPNFLYRNLGPDANGIPQFKDVTSEMGVSQPLSSFPTWFWDYDNDGDLDIFVSDYFSNPEATPADYLGELETQEHARLYRNDGNTFTDISVESGLNHVMVGMGANFGDIDEDGFLDMYIGTGDPNLATLIPNRMFKNQSGKHFIDITSAGGFGHLQKGHGVSFGDIDNDGDQDVHASLGGAYSGDTYRNALFENPGHGNNWLKLKLLGNQSNRTAIGARILVTLKDGRKIYRTVGSGGSFGASPFRQEFGLGKGGQPALVSIFWPTTGKTQTFENLTENKGYIIEEGNPTPKPMTLQKFKIPRTMPEHNHH